MKTFKYVILFIVLAAGVDTVFGQGKWYANSSFQMVGSSFTDGERHNSYFLYGGLRYQSDGFSLSASVPLIFGSGNAFHQVGNTYITNEGGYDLSLIKI